MATHLEDLSHPKKRKFVFERAANDMVSEGYSVSVEIVKNKWKGLNRSYTKARDNKNLSGRGPSRFMFYDQMDEILGNKPTNQNNNSINSNEDFNILSEQSQDESIETTDEQIVDDVPKKEVKRRRLSEKQLKNIYIENKEEEYRKRQQRHDERIRIEQEKIEIERQKLELLRSLLQNKEK